MLVSRCNSGARMKRFKAQLKANIKACSISHTNLEQLASDRATWRRGCAEGLRHFEQKRVDNLVEKRRRRKEGAAVALAPTAEFVCDVCNRACKSRIGLVSHRRTHQRRKTRSIDFRRLNSSMVSLCNMVSLCRAPQRTFLKGCQSL